MSALGIFTKFYDRDKTNKTLRDNVCQNARYNIMKHQHEKAKRSGKDDANCIYVFSQKPRKFFLMTAFENTAEY